MGGGSWRCDGCGAAQADGAWACHWCGRARPRRDGAPLLPPPARSTGATRAVLALGAVAVLVLMVSIVAMAGAPGRRSAAVAPSGSYPGEVPAAAPSPPGMYAAPVDPSAVIDRASAEQVLDTYWETRRSALEQHDVARLRSVATGPTAEWEGSCGCVPTGPRVGDDHFTAPPQSAYPARFLAERTWRGDAASDASTVQQVSDLIVFVRPSAAEPWKAVIHAGVVEGHPFDAVLADPFSMPLPEVVGPVDPMAVPEVLAAYFQAWHGSGAAPVGTPVRDDGMVRTRGEAIWQRRNAIEAQGVHANTAFRSGLDEDGIYEFWGGGGRLVCGTVRWTGEAWAPPGGAVVQPPVPLLPPFVPPGRYASVVTSGVRQACVTLADQLDVEVMVGGDTTATYVGV